MLNLLALCIHVEAMLEGCAIGLDIGGISQAEAERLIPAAGADCFLAFGAVVEVLLHLAPGFLQGVSLLLVPLGAIDLLTRLGCASPEATEQANADVRDIGDRADGGTDRARIDLPVALSADKTEREKPLTLVAHILINTWDDVVLFHASPHK